MARRLWPLLVVGGLLAAVAVLSVLSRPGFRHIPVPPTVREKYAQTAPPVTVHPSGQAFVSGAPAAITHRSSLLITIAGWACAAAAFVVIGFLIWYFVKAWLESATTQRSARAAAGVPKLTRREAVLAAVDAGISELARADGDARAAIIACWVRLEDVAEAAGTPRAPGDTSSDLVARLLGDHQVSRSVLVELAGLYRTARYSTARIEASMRDQALAAFEHLRTELMESRSGQLAEDPQFEAATIGGRSAGRVEDPDGQRRRPSPRQERS